MDVGGRRCACVLLLALLHGCATQTLQRTGAFSRAGVDYADAVVDFVDAHLQSRIDTNSKDALRARRQLVDARLDADLPRTLEGFDAEAFEAVRQAARLRDSLRTLHAYFEALNALAAPNAGAEAGASLKALATSISDFNTVVSGDAKLFGSEQLGHVDRVGRLAVRAAVAAQVRDALERDKRAIAWQLAWQERALRILVEPMRVQFERDLEQFRRAKVVEPFASATARPDTAWINDRRRWIQAKFQVDAFAKAKAAAERMRAEWEAILEGRSDVQSLRLALAELRDLTGAIRAFDDAQRRN